MTNITKEELQQQIEHNRKLFQSQVDKYKNTLVLDLFNVVRLEGLMHGDDDFYWVLESDLDGIYHLSCVMDFIPLKEVLPEKNYNSLVRIWNLNHESQAD